MENQRCNENVPREHEEQERTPVVAGFIANRVVDSQDNVSQTMGEQEQSTPNVSNSLPDELPSATSSNLMAASEKTAANTLAGTENQNTDMAHDDTEGGVRQDGAEKKFTTFSKLPAEIRVMIWQLSLSGRRFVEIYIIGDRSAGGWRGVSWYPVCIDKAPPPFFTCHEARREVTKTYKLLEGNKPCRGAVWTDMKKDVLCFRDWPSHFAMGYLLDSLPSNIRELVTYLALGGPPLDGYPFPSGAYERNLSRLPALKEVFLSGDEPELDFDDPDNDYIKNNGVVATGFVEYETECLRQHKNFVERETGVAKANNPQWEEPLVRTGCYIFSESMDHGTDDIFACW